MDYQNNSKPMGVSAMLRTGLAYSFSISIIVSLISLFSVVKITMYSKDGE